MRILKKEKNVFIAELTPTEIYKIVAEGLEYSPGSRAPIVGDLIKLDHIFERLAKEKSERGFLEQTKKELETIKSSNMAKVPKSKEEVKS